jgi:hypothetical protein
LPRTRRYIRRSWINCSRCVLSSASAAAMDAHCTTSEFGQTLDRHGRMPDARQARPGVLNYKRRAGLAAMQGWRIRRDGRGTGEHSVTCDGPGSGGRGSVLGKKHCSWLCWFGAAVARHPLRIPAGRPSSRKIEGMSNGPCRDIDIERLGVLKRHCPCDVRHALETLCSFAADGRRFLSFPSVNTATAWHLLQTTTVHAITGIKVVSASE